LLLSCYRKTTAVLGINRQAGEPGISASGKGARSHTVLPPPLSRCIVQGRPRTFPRSLDSRNARNKLVPLDLRRATPRRGVAVEKKASRERMCCEKTQGLHYYFSLSLFHTGRPAGRGCTSYAPLYLLGTSRLVVSLFIPPTNTSARCNDDKIEGLLSICFFVAPPRRPFFFGHSRGFFFTGLTRFRSSSAVTRLPVIFFRASSPSSCKGRANRFKPNIS